jgi:hypothetical protein
MKVELEWLKERLPRTRETTLQGIDFNHETLSVRRQCQLLGDSSFATVLRAGSRDSREFPSDANDR